MLGVHLLYKFQDLLNLSVLSLLSIKTFFFGLLDVFLNLIPEVVHSVGFDQLRQGVELLRSFLLLYSISGFLLIADFVIFEQFVMFLLLLSHYTSLERCPLASKLGSTRFNEFESLAHLHHFSGLRSFS